MNIPIFFNHDYTGELNVRPISSSSSSSNGSSSSSIELEICQKYGYSENPTNCNNQIELIIENKLCYSCAELIIPSSSSSSSSSLDPYLPEEPIYFINPSLLENGKKISLNSGNLLAFSITNPYYNYNTPGQSSVQLFKKNEDYSWEYFKTITGNFENNFANFGNSIKFNKSGNKLFIGAPQNDSFFIFSGANQNWSEQKITGKNNTNFGYQITCDESGKNILISAPKDESGKVYLYTGKDDSLDYNIDYVFNEDIDGQTNYGHSISTNDDGSLVAIGAPTYKSGIGAVYIYKKQNQIWNQFKITGSSQWSFFGFNVALSSKSNKLLISSILENENKGLVYVYTGLNNEWNLSQKISGEENATNFGLVIDVNENGDVAAISNSSNEIHLYSGDSSYSLQKIHKKDAFNFGKNIALNTNGEILGTKTETGFYVYTNIDLRINTLIDIDDIPNKKYSNTSFSTYAESNRSGDLFYDFSTISSTTPFDCCQVDNSGVVQILSPGTGKLKVYQLENDLYKSGYAEKTIIIEKQDQIINLKPIPNKTYGDPSFRLLGKTTNVNLPIYFGVSGSSVATITDQNLLNIIGAGTVSILATQSGNAYYNQAQPVTLTFEVQKKNQYITFNPLKEYYIQKSPTLLTASATSNLPVTITSNNNNVLLPTVNQAILLSEGTVSLQATQAGNQYYNPAESIIKKVNVVNETENCLDVYNIKRTCDCGNECRNCCGIDLNAKIDSYFKTNQSKYNMYLTVQILNNNCDDIADFIKIYCNNKLMHTEYYFVKKDANYSNQIEIKNISLIESYITIKCVAEEFGRQNTRYLYLSLNG